MSQDEKKEAAFVGAGVLDGPARLGKNAASPWANPRKRQSN